MVEAVEVAHQGEGEEEGPEQGFEEPHVAGFEGLGEAAAGEPVEGGGEGFGSAGSEVAVEVEGTEDGEDGDEGEKEGDAQAGHSVFEHGLPAALFIEEAGEEAGHDEEHGEAEGVEEEDEGVGPAAGLGVFHPPDAVDGCVHSGAVEDDAKQHHDAAERVEGVIAIGVHDWKFAGV